MSRNILTWYNNAGVVVFNAADAFSRSATRTLETLGRPRSHMRVGQYSVVLVNNDIVAAPMYDNASAVNDVTLASPYWESHKSDRMRQLAAIESALRDSHPHAADIRRAIADERHTLSA